MLLCNLKTKKKVYKSFTFAVIKVSHNAATGEKKTPLGDKR